MTMVSKEEPIVTSRIVHSIGDAVELVCPGDRVVIEPGWFYRRYKKSMDAKKEDITCVQI